MLSAINQANLDPDRPDEQVFGSLDAVGLYPSMEADETSDRCARLIVQSGVCFELVDWEEALSHFKWYHGRFRYKL